MSSIRARGFTWRPNRSRELTDPRLGGAHVDQDAVPHRLRGEDDVLRHRHHRDEHEVLVDHAHARVDRGARRPELDGLALDQDLALVGVVEPVEDVHEGRLARAVLAEQGVHLPLAEVEAHVVVRDDPREPLRDVPHLEDLGVLGHCARSYAVPDSNPTTNGSSDYSRGISISPSAIRAETSSSASTTRLAVGRFGLTLP